MFGFADGPIIMGILNATPDSFHDGGHYNDLVSRGRQLIEEGAHCIDIGGESTRPGASDVSAEEEMDRVLPLIEALSPLIPISIDTTKAEVAVAASEAGATILNDVRGLIDSDMVEASKQFDLAIVMHSRGTPKTMRGMCRYDNLVKDVFEFLIQAANRSQATQTWIDPGIGFAKTTHQSLALLKATSKLTQSTHKVLIGASRKSFIGETLHQPKSKERLIGSLAAVASGFHGGAHAFRVHDVQQTKEMLDLLQAIKSAGQ